jgi:hypothetical protein
MIRRLALTHLVLLSAFAVFAQQPGSATLTQPSEPAAPFHPRSSIALSVGPSFPLGEFGKSNPSDNNAGFAKAGHLFSLAYLHPVRHTNLSLTAQLWGRLNELNESALVNGFSSKTPGYSWHIPVGYYKTAAVMLGATYGLSITAKLRAEAGLMGGIAESRFPGYTVTGEKTPGGNPVDPQLLQASLSSGWATSFSVLGELGFTYRLNHRLHLLAHMDYWQTKPTFKQIVQTGTTGYIYNNGSGLNGGLMSTSYSGSGNITQAMNSLNFTAGVAWTL